MHRYHALLSTVLSSWPVTQKAAAALNSGADALLTPSGVGPSKQMAFTPSSGIARQSSQPEAAKVKTQPAQQPATQPTSPPSPTT